MSAVNAREIDAPEGVSPVHWLIVTTHAIKLGTEAAKNV